MPLHQSFVDYFVREFMEELWYLQKVARGDIPARQEAEPLQTFFNVTQALLSIAPIPGLPLGFLLSKELVAKCVEYGGQALALIHQAQEMQETAQQFLASIDVAQSIYKKLGNQPDPRGMLQQEGPMDLVAIQVLVELLGRGLAERYEHVLTEYLAEPAEKSQIPLARVMAKRLFSYLQNEPLLAQGLAGGLLAQRNRLLNGVVLGNLDKSWREKLSKEASHLLPRAVKEMHQVSLPLKLPYQQRLGLLGHFTAEGVFKRCAWYDDHQVYGHANTDWQPGAGNLRQPKYGYAYLGSNNQFPDTLVGMQAYRGTEAPPRASQYSRAIGIAEIQAYLGSPDIQAARAQKTTATLSFHDFLRSQGHPNALEAVCHDDLSAIPDWSFADFNGVDFCGATIAGNLSGSNFSNAYLVSLTAQKVYCDLSHPVNLKGAKLGFGDWREARLPKADLSQSDLTLTNLSQADLTDIQSTGANWYKTDLTDVKREDLLALQQKQITETREVFEKGMKELDSRVAQLEQTLSSALDRIEVQHTDVEQQKALLHQLKAQFELLINVSLIGPGDVGRKLLAEHTIVQLTHRLKDLEFYLPPAVIKALPKDMSLEKLMSELNSPTEPAPETVAKLPMLFDVTEVIETFLQQDEALLLLLGDQGAGKSLSTWQATRRLVATFEADMSAQQISECWLPLHVELNQFSQHDLGGLIDHQLKVVYQLSDTAITKLKQGGTGSGVEPKVLLIMDGYDELRQDNADRRTQTNLFQRIGGNTWARGQLKVLVTCRRHYLRDERDESMIFGVGEYSRYQRFELLPFALAQIHQYIEMRSSTEVGGGLLKAELYFQIIQSSKSIQTLISNPFVLQLFLESLPRLIQKDQDIRQLVRYDLYQAFFDQWLEREVRRMTLDKKKSLGRASDVDLVQDFKRLARYLALSMYASGSITVAFNQPRQPTLDYQVWFNVLKLNASEANEEYLALAANDGESEDDLYGLEASKPKLDKATMMGQAKARTQQLVDVLPLSPSGGVYHFMHKSFYEYLVVDSLIHLHQEDKAFEASALSFFKQRLIQTEPAVLGFLTELATPAHPLFEGLCSRLFALIQRSAREPSLGQASSNAATILNYCGVQLTYQQWAGVQLMGADLSYGVLAHSQLPDANLDGVNLTRCMLYQANFRGANLAQVQWGEYPQWHMEEKVCAIAHHPKEPWIAIGQYNVIVIKHRDTGAVIFQIRVRGYFVDCVAFSPDGSTLVSGCWGSLSLWDIQRQQVIGKPMRGSGSVAFSPDGSKLVSGGGGSLCLWDVQTQQVISEVTMEKSQLGKWVTQSKVESVAFSHDGAKVAFIEELTMDSLCLYDIQTQQVTRQRVPGGAQKVAFSPNSSLLVIVHYDGTLCFWDSQTQQMVGKPMKGHSSQRFSCLVFSPDGTMVASGADDATVRLWDVQTQQAIGQPMVVPTIVNGVVFSPDGSMIVSAGRDNSVRLWDVRPQQVMVQAMKGHSNVVGRVIFSPDGSMMVSIAYYLSCLSECITVRLWDLRTQQMITQQLAVCHPIYNVAFSPEGLLILSGEWNDTEVHLWDTQTQQVTEQLMLGVGIASTRSVFSPDGSMLALLENEHTLQLWSARRQQAIGQAMKHEEGIRSWAFSPDGSMLAVLENNFRTLQLWSTQGQQVIGQAMGHEKSIGHWGFSPDGLFLLTSTSGVESGPEVLLWDVSTQQVIGEPIVYSKRISNVIFSADAAMMLPLGEDPTLRLWDTRTQQQIGQPMVGHTGEIYTAVFSAKGDWLVSSGADKTLRLWHVHALLTQGKTEGMLLMSWDNFISSLSLAPASVRRGYSLSEGEEIVVLGDAFGAISFWVVSFGAEPKIRLLAMPKHPGIPLMPVGTQFSGCKMSRMSHQLLAQQGADVRQALVVEETKREPEAKSSPGSTGLFANKAEKAATSPKAKSAVDSLAQNLLKDILAALDETYPPEDEEHSQQRQALLTKLKPYQERKVALTLADRTALLRLQLELAEISESRVDFTFAAGVTDKV